MHGALCALQLLRTAILCWYPILTPQIHPNHTKFNIQSYCFQLTFSIYKISLCSPHSTKKNVTYAELLEGQPYEFMTISYTSTIANTFVTTLQISVKGFLYGCHENDMINNFAFEIQIEQMVCVRVKCMLTNDLAIGEFNIKKSFLFTVKPIKYRFYSTRSANLILLNWISYRTNVV